MFARTAVFEVNFDGIPGPTHNYAGLAPGNLAAERNANLVSNPRAAALQGLHKMRTLASMGYAQAVLPPHERPAVSVLRSLGFLGKDAQVLSAAARDAPRLLAACSSAASMWVANAATVSASSDTRDAKVHFTPANLVTHFHRSIEAQTTTRILRAIFADAYFVVHDPLPSSPLFGDEGAANHTRFVADDGGGVDFLVYGRDTVDPNNPVPTRYPARQTSHASLAIARRHGLNAARTVFAQQLPTSIDAGVFHNDVIAVGAGQLLFCHARAYMSQQHVLVALRDAVGDGFHAIVVGDEDVTVDEAVQSYLFNSQLLRREDGRWLLLAPSDVQTITRVVKYLDRLVGSGGPIAQVLTFDLRQSMRNGGGPACLRLRVPLRAEERDAVAARVFLDDALAADLESWIREHYRDRIAPEDLRDPALLYESRCALDELTTLLRLPAVYDFQRDSQRN